MPLSDPGTFPRPCPIPGHPEDPQDTAGPMVPESAWRRFRAWHMQAPAERLPLTGIAVTWPAAWALREARVQLLPVIVAGSAVTVLAWLLWTWHARRYDRALRASEPARQRLLPTEAAGIAAAGGAWVAAVVHWGPLAPPGAWPTVIYLAGAFSGYRWLRRHPAVRAARDRREAAAAWLLRKIWWHEISHRAGLGDFDLQEEGETLLGRQFLLTSNPGSGLASRIAANSSAICETLCHLLGLPYGRIEVTTTQWPGQLLIGVREQDPSAGASSRHPALDPASAYADLFPPVATVREPVPLLVEQETGEVHSVRLWTERGGVVFGVYARIGSGKTTVLDDLRERITVMPDAVHVDVNGAKVGDELAWAPLAGATVAGSVRFDEPEGTTGKVVAVLDWLVRLITSRTQTLPLTGDSVFQPTGDDPAVIAFLDEIDEAVTIPGVARSIEFIASKGRQASVSLGVATQRAVNQWTGGGGVKASLDWVLVGNMNRASETRHATGAEHEIPDISDYSKGEPGFFQIWKPAAKQVVARGRAFDIGTIGEQQRHIIWRRDPAARPTLPGPALDLDGIGQREPARVDESSRVQSGDDGGMRARLARAVGLLDASPAQPKPRPAIPQSSPSLPPATIQGVPPQSAKVVLRLLSAPEGTTAASAAQELRKSKSTAHEYLTAACQQRIAERTGGGRGSRYRLAGAQAPEPRTEAATPEPRPYLTIEQLAQVVVDGLVEATPEQRQVLEQAHDMIRRQRITIVRDSDGDAP
jgi:hypothetical protein